MDPVVDFTAMTQDFGTSATLGGVAVRGIFDKTPAIAQAVIGGVDPTYQLLTSVVPADPRALILILSSGISYTVRDWADDGLGVTTLQLESA